MRVRGLGALKRRRPSLPPAAGDNASAPEAPPEKPRFPVAGSSSVQWSTAVELSFVPDELPSGPSALAVRLTLVRGHAGVGWYDIDGLAEEVHVGPGPLSRTVHLSLWDPRLGRALIVRSVRREPLDVTVEGIAWLPLRRTLADARWRSGLDGLPDDCFLDAPFKGLLTEALWRADRDKNGYAPELRLRRLKRLVSLAWQHCPGYRDWWTRHGWHPSDLRSIEDAAAIPPVTKEQIRADIDAFSLPRRNALIASTTGSTGQVFSFRYTPALRAAHHAQTAIASSHAIPGLPPWQTRLAILTARAPRGLSATGAAGSLMLSHAAPRRPEILLELLRAYRPPLLYALPGPAARLAGVLGGMYRFRGAVLTSENMLPSQIEAAGLIADRVIATYGLSEGAAFALRCPSCGAYGELPGHGVTTLRRRPEGSFEIIGTGFWALGTLFIGYATGDLTAGPVAPCPDCTTGGIHFAHVLGREQDVLVDGDGASFSVALLYRVLFPVMPKIRLYDFLQVEPGRATLRYLTNDGARLDHESIERALRRVLPTLSIGLEMTPGLPAMHEALPPGTKWKMVKTADRATQTVRPERSPG
jgi:phenylacetate-coenzyme A ligase PaaK-like adenylate-forming protein